MLELETLRCIDRVPGFDVEPDHSCAERLVPLDDATDGRPQLPDIQRAVHASAGANGADAAMSIRKRVAPQTSLRSRQRDQRVLCSWLKRRAWRSLRCGATRDTRRRHP